ncbi:hypothetical protein IMZ48_00365, partial [Candidatus Bathyarchaeota archaeon]|nr:hypothetical protein [Candidatus Bathyarchaeota archaeon]
METDPVTDTSQLAITAELDEPLRVRNPLSPPPSKGKLTSIQILNRNLDFLRRALATAPLRRTVRAALDKLQDALWSGVLTRQHFTALGAAQFVRDLDAIVALVEKHVRGGSGALRTVLEGARLLALPMEAEGGLGLKEVSDRVFTDGGEARGVLGELG